MIRYLTNITLPSMEEITNITYTKLTQLSSSLPIDIARGNVDGLYLFTFICILFWIHHIMVERKQLYGLQIIRKIYNFTLMIVLASLCGSIIISLTKAPLILPALYYFNYVTEYIGLINIFLGGLCGEVTEILSVFNRSFSIVIFRHFLITKDIYQYIEIIFSLIYRIVESFTYVIGINNRFTLQLTYIVIFIGIITVFHSGPLLVY